jgi:hypothetical protein
MGIPITKRPSVWTNRHNLRRVTPPPIYSTSPPDKRLTRILDAVVAEPKSINKSEFIPVLDYKTHIRLLKQSSHPQCLIDKFRVEHEEYYASLLPTRKKSDPGAFHVDLEYTDQVMVKTTIEGDVITTELITPRETLDMYRLYGVCEEGIRKLEKRIRQFEESIPGREDHLKTVFSKFTGKSQSKKKVSSLRSRMCKRAKVILKSEIGDEE